MTGTCKLCGNRGALVKSHIIPRSFVHRSKGDSKQILAIMGREKRPIEYHQSGVWDNTLLCAGCESIFGLWDQYGFEIFGCPPGNNNAVTSDKHIPPFLLRDIKYPELKLFVLSMLWRMSVTKHPFFDGIRLGPHESRIADLLRTKDPGPPETYAVVVFRLIRQQNEHVVYAPWWQKMDGINFNVLYLPCIKLSVKVDLRPMPQPLRDAMLQPTSENIAVPIDLQQPEHFFLREASKTGSSTFVMGKRIWFDGEYDSRESISPDFGVG